MRRPDGAAAVTVFTIGHSTRSIEEVIALLHASAIEAVIDVRRFPGSRRHPQFNAGALAEALAAAGIAYRHMPALGGRRSESADAASPHSLWREAGFRNYAAYAETDAFRAGFEELKRAVEERRSALMCAEAVWWRCHRRIIADYLIAAGLEVRHILGPGKVEEGRLTPGATIRADGSVLYGAPTLL